MLNDTQLRELQPKDKLYRVSDSHGLCIEINPNGSKLWRHRYRFNNKATMLALGTYPEVSLLDARQSRDRNKQLLKQGLNPKIPKINNYKDNPDEISFKGMFFNWLNNKKDAWTPGYAEDTLQRANSYLLPTIGEMPIDEISSPDMLNLLFEIQDKGLLDTLKKVKGIANGVFSHSVGMGIITVNPVRDLPNDIFKKKPIKHHATITDPKEIGLLLNMLENHIGSDEVNAALTIAPHVFLRPGELTGFTVYVGGGLGAAAMVAAETASFVPVEDILSYLESAMRIYNLNGRRDHLKKLRIKFLVRQLGAEEYSRLVDEDWKQTRDDPELKLNLTQLS